MKLIKKIAYRVFRKFMFLKKKVSLLKSKKNLKRLRNVHKGERCFIIGNGPSLDVNDLKKLKGEICFGTHRIYEIFGDTDWRPTYYCAQDHNLIKTSTKNINQVKTKYKFIAIYGDNWYKELKGGTFIKLDIRPFYPELPNFSEDISDCIFEGFTVSYMCLQIAAYMGFKEIYLLGIDHNYSKVILPDGTFFEDNKIQDHFSKKDLIENVPQLFKSTLAYEKAKNYAESNEIKIFNATRGGKLDVFNRINFDSIFQNKIGES